MLAEDVAKRSGLMSITILSFLKDFAIFITSVSLVDTTMLSIAGTFRSVLSLTFNNPPFTPANVFVFF